MKLSPLVIAAAAAVVVLIAGIVYVDLKIDGRASEIASLRNDNAALGAQVASLKAQVDSLSREAKLANSAIGEKGTLQVLARGLASGDMELTLRSLKIVSGGKAVVTLGSGADQGGSVSVAAADGSASAELAAAAGKAKMAFRAESGADAAHVVAVASLGTEGLYMQRGPSDSEDTRTEGAGLKLADSGASLFVARHGAGNFSFDTPAGDVPARLSVWSDGDPDRHLSVALGANDAAPTLSVSGSGSGQTLWLAPDRLTLLAKDGTVVLGAAQDDNGGFLFVNDTKGTRKALVTAGTEGHGSVAVYGDDKRSNTLFPVYNIQQSGPTQK